MDGQAVRASLRSPHRRWSGLGGVWAPGAARAAPISSADSGALAARCAPAVPSETLEAVARTESGLDPWALHDNTTGVSVKARGLEAALADARQWIGRGDPVDLGLMQINSENLGALGMTARAALDPCASLAGGAAVLQAAYSRREKQRRTASRALDGALPVQYGLAVQRDHRRLRQKGDRGRGRGCVTANVSHHARRGPSAGRQAAVMECVGGGDLCPDTRRTLVGRPHAHPGAAAGRSSVAGRPAGNCVAGSNGGRNQPGKHDNPANIEVPMIANLRARLNRFGLQISLLSGQRAAFVGSLLGPRAALTASLVSLPAVAYAQTVSGGASPQTMINNVCTFILGPFGQTLAILGIIGIGVLFMFGRASLGIIAGIIGGIVIMFGASYLGQTLTGG